MNKELTFWEAASILIGHGVGSGILAAPFLASRSSWKSFLLIVLLAYGINLLLHWMIAELSLANGGAQFVRCFERELFSGVSARALAWCAFALLAFSVVVSVSGFLTGAAAVFDSWFGLPRPLGMALFYALGAGVVLFGAKLVGVCEKLAVSAMLAVVGVLFIAVLRRPLCALPAGNTSAGALLALYSIVSFSLSAVMSVPQVVKGLGGDIKRIRGAIAAGTAVNAGLIALVTFMTLLGAGSRISGDGALVDLAACLGGWAGVVGYAFTLLALATSFWANTLNLCDLVCEQTGWSRKAGWAASSLPSLAVALLGVANFVGFARFAGVILVVTGIGIIAAYARARRRTGESAICGALGGPVFQALVILGTLGATVGALIPVR